VPEWRRRPRPAQAPRDAGSSTGKPSAVVPGPQLLPCTCVNRRVGRTSGSSRPILGPYVWAGVKLRHVRNDHHPDQRPPGHGDRLPVGAGGHRKIGIDERRQPYRRLAAIGLTLGPGRRPRLRRSQPRLPIRWPQLRRIHLRACTTEALGPTLYQHVETCIAAIHHACRRASSPPGSKSAAERHSHDDRGGYNKAGRANHATHGHSMRHPKTAAKPRVATHSQARLHPWLPRCTRSLPTRYVVIEDGPHPSAEPVSSPPGPSRGRPHRPCHLRAIRHTTAPVSHGQPRSLPGS
jgi:hypothetical protein